MVHSTCVIQMLHIAGYEVPVIVTTIEYKAMFLILIVIAIMGQTTIRFGWLAMSIWTGKLWNGLPMSVTGAAMVRPACMRTSMH